MIPLKRDQNGRLKAGYFRPKTHKIVNLNHCPVLDPRLDALVEPLKKDLDAGGGRPIMTCSKLRVCAISGFVLPAPPETC